MNKYKGIADIVEYGQSLSTQQLSKLLKKAEHQYFNTDSPIMGDDEYDLLSSHLLSSTLTGIYDKIGSPPPKLARNKVSLPFHMGSLDKVKVNTVDEWLAKNPGPYVVMDKMDGVSLAYVVYVDGTTKLYTRGDGTIGQDVSHLLPALNLPEIITPVEIRAEIEMSNTAFEKYAEDFVNPRNLVSGLVNKLEVDPAVKDLSVFCYEIISQKLKKSFQLRKLKSLGFNVPGFKCYDSLSAERLSTIFDKRRSKNFKIDGLVIEVDKVNTLPDSGNPSYAVAFKVLIDEDVVTATVKNVIWNPSQYGYLKPRIEIVPLTLGGVTVTYATGFNAKFIRDNGIGVGATVRIVRSGDVIPHVVDVERNVEPLMPTVPYTWTETGVDAVQIADTKETQVKKLTYFFKTIGVENFSSGLISRFMDHGLDSVSKICSASKDDILEVDGIKEKMATKITTNIKKSLMSVTLPTLMDASGVFGRGFGERRMKDLVSAYPSIMRPEWGTDNVVERVSQVNGFSEKLGTQFAKNLDRFKEFIKTIPVTFDHTVQIKSSSGSKLCGKVIVFTGFRDKELQQTIEDNGGILRRTVSKVTTVLLIKDVESTSSKADNARRYGVRLMTPEDFREEYEV